MNKYSVTYPFVLQVLIQVLYLIILCSIKETNLDKKKMNFKTIIASKLQISWRVVNSSRTVWINLNFHYSQRRTHDQFIAGAKVLNVASLLRDYKKGACLYTSSQVSIHSKWIYPDTLRINWDSETAFNFTISYKYIRNFLKVQSDFQAVSWETWLHLEWLISCFSSEKKSSDSIIRNFQDFFHKIYNCCQTKIWSVLKKSHENPWLTVSLFS